MLELELLRNEIQVTLSILVGLVHELHLGGFVDLERLGKLAVLQLSRMTTETGASPKAYGQLRLPFALDGHDREGAVWDGEFVYPSSHRELAQRGGETNAESDAGA